MVIETSPAPAKLCRARSATRRRTPFRSVSFSLIRPSVASTRLDSVGCCDIVNPLQRTAAGAGPGEKQATTQQVGRPSGRAPLLDAERADQQGQQQSTILPEAFGAPYRPEAVQAKALPANLLSRPRPGSGRPPLAT